LTFSAGENLNGRWKPPTTIMLNSKGKGQKKKKINRLNVMSIRLNYQTRVSTGTAVTLIVQMDVDRVAEFTTELLGLFLCESTTGNDWKYGWLAI